MTDQAVEQILTKYRPFGQMKGGELLLPPDSGLQLIDELARLDVLLLGVDVWYESDGNIAQDLSSLDLSASRDKSRNVALAHEFIAKDLPERVKFVSVVFDHSAS